MQETKYHERLWRYRSTMRTIVRMPHNSVASQTSFLDDGSGSIKTTGSSPNKYSKSCFLSYKLDIDEMNTWTLNNKYITKKSQSMKFLVIHISYDMKWDLHMKLIAHKIVSNCYGLLRPNNTLNIRELKSINFGYINSSLKYGIILWGNSTICKKLFTLQKRAVLYIVKARKPDSCKPHFKLLNIQ